MTGVPRSIRLTTEPPVDDPQYVAACHLKQRYLTRGYAKQAARRHRKLGHDRLTAYRCPYCGCWHLGHSTPRRNP